MFVLLVVQAALEFAGPAGLRALHPVLGLLVLGAAAHIALSARRGKAAHAQSGL